MKKFLATLMSFILIMASVIVVNADDVLTLSVASIDNAEPGNTYDVAITLEGNSAGIFGVAFDLTVSEGAEITNVVAAETCTLNMDDINYGESGSIVTIVFESDTIYKESALCNVTIKVLDDAKEDINVQIPTKDCYVVDGDINEFTPAISYGKIDITADAPQPPVEPEEPEEPTLEGIKVSGAKTSFHLGDAFTTGGLVVTAVYSDETEEVVAASDYEVVAPDMTEAGTVGVIVKYDEYEASYDITIAPHTFGEWVTDADGHYKACECGVKTDEGDHEANDAACTEDTICKVCGYVMAEAAGHNYGEAVTKFDDAGHWTEKVCAECGDKIVTEKVAHEGDESCSCGFTAHKHNIVNNGKNYDSESHWNICTKCDEIFDKEPHNLVTIIEETDIYHPTTEIVCTYCVECLYRVVYENHVHKYEQQYDSRYHWDECIDEDCRNIINHEKHDYTGWYVVTEATEENDGIERRDCLVCDYYQEQPIKKGDDGFDKYDAFAMAMLAYRNRSLEIIASSNEGGTITPDGVTKVKPAETVKYFIEAADGYAIKTVLVDDKEVGAVTEYTFKNVQKNHTIEVVFEKTAWANPFTDVAADAAYIDAIEFVYENGLFQGVSETEFAPDVTMTRAMFVTVLGRLSGVNAADFAGASFADVVEGEWYAPYVAWAAQNGIVLGYGDGNFGVNDEITVEQAVVIMARYASFIGQDITAAADLSVYADAAEVADWALSQMQWAVAQNIYAGAAGELNPKDPAARALVAEILYAFAK